MPWITAAVGGRYHLGVNDPLRVQEAFVKRLCQICGEPLKRRFTLLVRPADTSAGYCSEPGMHPDCLAYTTAACPLLNGSIDRYRSKPPTALAALLPDPAESPRTGAPADAFDAWLVSASGYQLAWHPRQPGGLLGLRLDVLPLAKTPVRAAARPRLTAEQTALLRLLLDLGHIAPASGQEPV